MRHTAMVQLRHCTDDTPGITRQQIKGKWAYYSPDGDRITDREEIDRLNAIALPPAYTDAWFCPHANGHIQATGRDAKGRKQYRYHADFRARQDKHKYSGAIEFGAALPKLRRKVDADLKRRTLDKDAVVAAVVRLIDTNFIRVGNEQYVKSGKSFGATTLRNRHLRREKGKLMMRFKGKHGIVHEVPIADSRLKRLVGRIGELPGQHLFQYLTDEGEACPITSADVNDYIREATGGDFTAKNFHTWGASVIAFEQMLEAQEEERRKISLKTVLEPVAEALGNTPAISRKSYVHPKLIEAARDNPKLPLGEVKRPRPRKWLSSEEVGLLDFLMKGARKRRTAAKPKAVEAVIKAADKGPAKVDRVAAAA
ncbi:DNA topoisomerase IB [Sphingomonas ginsengisoli (ex An et al. 2013)]|uniref:DNA topoisomerase IB n=2 Tax=Sphingomonas TaxID=13687 RepID=UPI000DF01066|nr:DNA topoisomerase IB [Sphingomonas ginsengisoli An et al. 2013]